MVIAECGSCHDGSVEKADRLITAAKAAGADAAKFQFWSSADRMARRRQAPEYRDIYARYQVPESWLAALKAECDAVGIEFMCSTYLPEDVPVVAPLVTTMKIASFEANDIGFLAAHVAPLRAGKNIIVSMGMGADWQVVEQWLGRGLLRENGARIRLLLCVSAYPAPMDAFRLQRLWRPGSAAGLSDHSHPSFTLMGALAVAAGATIVERHLRLDDTDESNPDAAAAMRPLSFQAYVDHIRSAEMAVGLDAPSEGGIVLRGINVVGGTANDPEADMRRYRVTEDR